MKILFVSHTGRFAGAERSLLTLATGLRERKGITPVFAFSDPRNGKLSQKLTREGIHNHFVKMKWWMNHEPRSDLKLLDGLHATKRFIDIIKEEKVDLVLTNTSVMPFAALAAALQEVKHAWFIREFGDLDHGLSFEYEKEIIYETINDLSDCVLTNSKTIKEHVLSFSDIRPIEQVYSSVAVNESSQSEQAYFDGNDGFKVAVLGTISPGKNQLEAIKGFAEFQNEHPKTELVVAGRTDSVEYFNKLRTYVAEAPVHNVQFAGLIDDPLRLIKQADAVVVPSPHEAMGRVAIEAMLQGTPVIGINSAGTKELIQDGETGLLYQPNDTADLANKLKFLSNNEKLNERIAKNAKAYAENAFSETTYVNRVYEIISAVKYRKKNIHPLFAQEALRALQQLESSKILSLFKRGGR